MDTATVTAISDYIRQHQSTPFEWGVFDCCIFASNVIRLQTGIDLYEPYVGKYKTEDGSKRALSSIGTIESQLDEHFERINPMYAQRGDIHMLETGVMAVQFSGHRWSTTTLGVSVVETRSKLCWRIK